MYKPTKEILIEILQALPDESEISIRELNVILDAYNDGYENAQCGFDAPIEQVFRNPHEVLRKAYSAGFERGK